MRSARAQAGARHRKGFNCMICGQWFKSRAKLTRHQRKAHG